MQPDSGYSSSKTTIAVLIFVLGCLVSSARLVVEAPRGRVSDEVARQSDLRFAQIRAALPTRGVVGYIGAPQDPVEHYYLAQYALAPLLVDRSLNHPLIVGNFLSSPPQLPANVEVLRDFGGGVLLLANKDQN
jgi:hypothetical protein